MFAARAALAANSPTIFSTNTLTGGPVLWNGSTTVVAAVLAVGFGITVVSTVAASVGFTGGTGQIAVMTATTAADSVGNLYLGGPNPTCTAYRTATPAAAGTFFYPLCDVVTGALTTRPGNVNWIDVGGLLVVPPNCWCAISASATTTTMVSQFTLIWEEVPL